MEKIMDQLIEEIKKQPYYLNFKESEKQLDYEKDLIQRYREVLDEYEQMKKYENYIDTSNVKEKLKSIKLEMNASLYIKKYYSNLHILNDQLDEITKLVFSGISDDLNIKLLNLDIIYKSKFMNISFIVLIVIFLLISLVNIKSKFYSSLKYAGSSMIISSAFMLIGGLFFDKIIPSLNKGVGNILESNRLKFLSELNHKSILFLIVGLVLVVLYAVIDTLYEDYKNKKLIENNIEIIEE